MEDEIAEAKGWDDIPTLEQIDWFRKAERENDANLRNDGPERNGD